MRGVFISYREIYWLAILGLLIVEWAMVRSLSSKIVTEFPGGRAEMAGYIAVVAAVIGWFLWGLSGK